MLTLRIYLSVLSPDEMTLLYLAVRAHVPEPNAQEIKDALYGLVGEPDAIYQMKRIERALEPEDELPF